VRILSFGPFIDYQIQLANELCKKEEIMIVIPENRLMDAYSGTIDENVKIRFLGKIMPFYHLENLVLLKNFINIIHDFKPDVIHLQLGGSIIDFALLPVFKIFPLVSTFHDVTLHLGESSLRVDFVRHWERKYSDKIIVHGKKLKEQMIREYHLPENKVHSIPIGEIEVAPFKRYIKPDLQEDGNLVLFFGRIWKYKGLEYLIKAEPLITKEIPSAKIIIAGAGENLQKYENMMKNKGNFIIYNYRIPYNEGAELLQRCSLVVLPYIEASQSGVIPTAYGFKKPVVVTSVGSIPEIVDDGITGFIVPPKDVNALAEAIIKLLKDRELRRQMGENSYIKLKTDLSWDNIAEKTIQVYKETIRGKKCK
jgi:alpha-maltose-1-phosphate synthase